MTVWNNCTMDIYPLEDEYGELPCVVKIDGDSIRVEYRLDGKAFVYAGVEDGSGHYRVKGEGHDGRGTLQVFPSDLPDNGVLEGWYYEDQQQGMWRIHLNQ